MNDYEIVSIAERPDLLEKVGEAEAEGFAEFLLHDPVWETTFPRAMARYPECQLFLMEEGEAVFMGNAVRIPWDGDPDHLPDGTHGALEASLQCSLDDATTLCGVQGVALGKGRGSGRSGDLLAAFQSLAQRHGWRLVVPARALLKDQYPLIPMEDYASWRTPDGEAFDPWFRIQDRVGGVRLRVAPDALVIDAPVEDWQTWTGLAMPGPGAYVIPGGHAPVVVDEARRNGHYAESHLWYEYPVAH